MNISTKDKNLPKRLDVFLSEEMKISRSQVQKLIEDGLVLVNKKLPKKAGDRIKEGDKISVAKKLAKTTETKRSRRTDQNAIVDEKEKIKRWTIEDIQFIAITPDYLVVEKPNGMLTHSTTRGEKDSLAELLATKYPELKKVGEDPIRPGIVHRLDKEASGLLVVARTQKMFEHLKEQFKTRTIEKEYAVLAHDPMPRNWDEIDFPIARSHNADRMAARPTSGEEPDEDNKNAKTELFLDKNFVNFSLLKVKIHTGRMHQIRVHLLAYNHPVVGDPLYFQKKRKNMWDKKLGRLFLHSSKLAFADLAGTKVTFESCLPKELSDFLETLT